LLADRVWAAARLSAIAAPGPAAARRPHRLEGRPHLLTCRQAGHTFRLVVGALGKDQPDGVPAPELQRTCDDLLEASVPEEFKDASSSLAVDWSALESFSRPPPRGTSDCADPEASWGHRRNNLRHDEDELFFGWYLPDAIMVPDEQGPPVPETQPTARSDSPPVALGAEFGLQRAQALPPEMVRRRMMSRLGDEQPSRW
jgi:hypothetical protein